MGNHSMCGGAPQHCVDECARLQMETRSREGEDPECDPAGAVFDETLDGLAQIDQQALRFAGTSNLSALRWLLAMGANPRARDRNGTTLLHAACRCGSYSVVRELVQRALPPDAVDAAGWTPLHTSAVMGRRDVALLLLRAGASAAARNGRGSSPLGVCSDLGTREVLEQFGAGGRAALPPLQPASASAPGRGIPASSRQRDIATVTCEPFFVPRLPLFRDEAHRAENLLAGVAMLNRSVGHGLAFVVAVGLVHDHPSDLCEFLARHSVSPTQLGRFLGEDFSLAQTLRLALIHSADLAGTGVVGALAKAFGRLRAPPDLIMLERLTSAAAQLWWRTHDADDWEEGLDGAGDCDGLDPWVLGKDSGGGPEGEGPQLHGEIAGMHLRRQVFSLEGLRLLMFSAVVLYWGFHGARHQRTLPGAISPRRLSFSSWLELNAGIEADGSSVPVQVQSAVYQLISEGGLPELLPGSGAAAPGGEGGAAPAPALGGGLSGWASVPHGGLERYQPALFSAGGDARLAGRALCETSGALRRPPAGPGAVASPWKDADRDEAVWLTLHASLLLFLSSGPDSAPYAFLRLEDAVPRAASRQERRLVLVGRPRAPCAPPGGAGGPAPRGRQPRTPFGDAERLPLPLCFLLADGRSQPFEALWLELQFSNGGELDAWVRGLGAGGDGRAGGKGVSPPRADPSGGAPREPAPQRAG